MKSIKSKAECRKEYQERYELFQRLLEAARGDIAELLSQSNIDTISTLGRVKKFDSYYKKVADGMEKSLFTNPIDEIQDIVGIRSILIFIDDLDKISSVLSSTFEIIKTERKGLTNPENAFGYESDHYVLCYKNVSGPRYKDLMGMKFEFQARTALMDAWASLSHKIDYKTDAAIPTKLKRVFFGLSGMFAVADKAFQDLKNASRQNQEKLLHQSSVERLFNQEINLDTLKVYVGLKIPRKFSNTDDKNYSEFIEEIKKVGGYNTIGDIDEAVKHALPVLSKIEKDLIGNGGLVDVGALRAVFDLYDDKYFERTNEFINRKWPQAILAGKAFLKKRKQR